MADVNGAGKTGHLGSAPLGLDTLIGLLPPLGQGIDAQGGWRASGRRVLALAIGGEPISGGCRIIV